MIDVLLIEDNSTDALVVRDGLEHAGGSGYAVTHVETLREALQLLRTRRFDVVLSDLSLPDSDGFATFEQLHASAPDVPTIVLTGRDDDKVAVQAVRAGAQDYILKGRMNESALERSIGYAIERQGFQQDLAKSRANLEEAQRIAQLGSWELDLSHLDNVSQNSLFWSDEVFRIFGLDPGDREATYEKFLRAVHPDDRDRVHDAVTNSIERRLPYDLVHRIPQSQREAKWVHARGDVVLDRTNGRPLRMVGTVQDITERKKAEEFLQRQNAELQVLFDLMPVMIWFKDTENRFLRANKRAADAIGATVEAFEGKSAHEIYPRDAAGFYADDLEVIRSGAPKLGIIETLHGPDGKKLWIQTDKVPYCDKDGKVIGIVVMAQDITKSRESEEAMLLLASAVDQARDSILITDAELDAPGPRILFVNPAFTKLTGHTVEEALGKTPRILQGPRTDRSVTSRLRESLSRGEPFHGEAINYRKDGTEFVLEWQVAPIREAGGAITHFVAIQHDITERKNAENALRDSEERFRQLAENIDEVFWMLDPHDGRILYVSPAYESIWGLSCARLCDEPHHWLEAVHPEDLESTLEASAHARDGNYDVQYRIVRPDQSVRWIRDRAFPVRNEAGEIYRIVGVAEDISDRRFSDEALKMQGRVLESMTEGVTVSDEQGEIVFSNAACNAMFGYEPDEITGQHMSVLNHMSQEESRKFERQLAAHLQERGFWTGELNSRKKDGSVFVTQSRISVLEIAGARSFVAVFEDITEKKNLESQFLRSQRMESVGRLSSGIAHDLNNILSPILMSVSMLRRQLAPAQVEKMLNMIESSTERGAALIKQLLTFGRGSEVAREVVRTRGLIEEMVKIIGGTFPKNIAFSVKSPEDCWPVMGDETQLHQVLLNLCVNARDAMPDGGALTLTAANIRLDASYAAMHVEAVPGPYGVLRVSDTGAGIPPDIINKIFDPFFTTKSKGKGTGLGLSTVIGIVKNHDGFLNLRSEVGSGSTFEIYLPAVPDALEAGMVAHAPAAPRGNDELILVVDDEPGIRDILESTLVQHGYRVLTAGDGTEAVALFSRHRGEIQMVMTDIMMPYMDGVIMSRTLKRIDPSIRIIASSGIGSAKGKKDKTAELRSLGIRTFLTKPFSATEFLTAIHESLAAASPAGP